MDVELFMRGYKTARTRTNRQTVPDLGGVDWNERDSAKAWRSAAAHGLPRIGVASSLACYQGVMTLAPTQQPKRGARSCRM